VLHHNRGGRRRGGGDNTRFRRRRDTAARIQTGRDGRRRAQPHGPRRIAAVTHVVIHRVGAPPTTGSSWLLLLHGGGGGSPHEEHVSHRTVAEPAPVRFFHAFGVTDVLSTCR